MARYYDPEQERWFSTEDQESGLVAPRDANGNIISAPVSMMAALNAIGGTSGLVAPGWMNPGSMTGELMSEDAMFSPSSPDSFNLFRDNEGFSAQQIAARNDFFSRFPGYAQVTSAQFGQDGFRPYGSPGSYLVDTNNVINDPTYGMITPVSNFGYSGSKGGFSDALKPLATMALMATGASLFGPGSGVVDGAGWTSGFDLPMGDFGGSWNLGSAAAPEGFSVAASLPEAASPALGSSEFSLVGAQAGNPGGGLYSGAFEGPSLVSSGNPGGFGLTGTASPGTLLTPQMAQSMGLPASAAMGGAGLTAMQAAGGVSTAANAAQAGSALSRFLGGNSTTQDNLSLLGNLAGTGLGLLGARQQSNAMGDIANRYLDMGAPYRSLLQQSYQPGFSMANQPDFQNAMDVGAQAAARATSAKVGNPVDNPGAYAEMQKYITGSLALPQLNTYRSQLGTFGGMGVNQAGTAQMGQAQAQGGMYDALGYGIGQMTQPDNPFKGLLDQFRNQTINSTRSF